jgi:CxxC-x17-CxxC domain-containing protein
MILEPCKLTCRDCGKDFEFDQGQADYFNDKHLEHYPSRCKDCSQVDRANQKLFRQNRTMFPATCAQCGAVCSVPFEPKPDRAVYCSECYAKVKASRLPNTV